MIETIKSAVQAFIIILVAIVIVIGFNEAQASEAYHDMFSYQRAQERQQEQQYRQREQQQRQEIIDIQRQQLQQQRQEQHQQWQQSQQTARNSYLIGRR